MSRDIVITIKVDGAEEKVCRPKPCSRPNPHHHHHHRAVFGIGPISEQKSPIVGGDTQSAPDRATMEARIRAGGMSAPRINVELTLTDSQQATIRLLALECGDDVVPISLNTTPAWFVDSLSSFTLTPSSDGLSCLIAASGLGSGYLFCHVPTHHGSVIAEVIAVTVEKGPPVGIAVQPGIPADRT